MRKSLFVILILLVFFSCNEKNYLEQADSLFKSIPFQDGYDICKDQINELISMYKKARETNRQSWISGYNQHCQILRFLHSVYGFYDDDYVFQEENKIYEEWFFYNPNDEIHRFPYAMCLLGIGRKEEGKGIITSLYNPNHIYNFDNPDLIDFANFFSGLLLNKIKPEDFRGTIYEMFLNYSEEDIIRDFSGS